MNDAGIYGEKELRVVPEWCSSGARVVPEWCPSGARVVLEWCSSGAKKSRTYDLPIST